MRTGGKGEWGRISRREQGASLKRGEEIIWEGGELILRVMMGRISAKSSSCIFLFLYNSFAAGTIQAPSQKISFSPPSLVILDILKDLLCKGYNILSVEFTIFEYTTEFVINPRMPLWNALSLSATLLAGFCPKQSFHIDWLSSCAASDWERKGNRSGCWSYLAMIRIRIRTRTRMMRMGLESDGDLGRKNPTARIFRSCESGRTAQQLKKGKLCSLRINILSIFMMILVQLS